MTVIDGRHTVGVPAMLHQYLELTKSAYDLWLDGRLLEELAIRDDGRTRVEIIAGEIVASPGPYLRHVRVVSDIHDGFSRADCRDPDYSWRPLQRLDFNLWRIGDGYVPDLIVLSADEFENPTNANLRSVTAEQVGMTVEVTSKSTAVNDRAPGPDLGRLTKWNGYAHEGVGFYLLVDRAPEAAMVTLFSQPDMPDGSYRAEQHWRFGETVVLPEPFGIEIPTEGWQAWDE